MTVTAGKIAAKYQDLAEWVPAATELAPGTLVVLAEDRINTVAASKTAYDTRVAGVVSAQPGIILGEQGDGKVRVATTERVRLRVDATKAPIRIGDLLVAGNQEGTAMRFEEFEVAGMKTHRPGTITAKALEPLATGDGGILSSADASITGTARRYPLLQILSAAHTCPHDAA